LLFPPPPPPPQISIVTEVIPFGTFHVPLPVVNTSDPGGVAGSGLGAGGFFEVVGFLLLLAGVSVSSSSEASSFEPTLEGVVTGGVLHPKAKLIRTTAVEAAK
jgi:hypothetical protein